MAAHGYREFTAGHDRHLPALGARLQGEPRMIGRNAAGLAFKVGTKIDNRIAGRASDFGSGVERGPRPGDQLEPRTGEGGIAALAALVARILKRAADRGVDRKPIFFHDGAGVGERGRIRHGRSGCDRGWIVVRHVRNRQRHDLGAPAGTRQPAALDARQMLAHGVDLADRRARAQQRPGHLLLLRERHAPGRCDPVGGAAARQQHQQQIVGAGILGETQAALRALQAGLVGHRMAGLDDLDAPGRQTVAVTGGRDSRQKRGLKTELVEVMPLRRHGHGGRGLAGGQTDHPAFRRGAQMGREHAVGVRGGHRGVEDRAQQRASIGHRFTGPDRGHMRRRLSIPLPQKKTPATGCGGHLAGR